LRQNSAAGVLARRALPVIIGAPIALGWIFVHARINQLIDRGMGTSILVLALIILFCGVLYWCGAAISIHEEHSRASEARLRSLLQLMPAAVYTCDAEGRITYYNRTASELWGCEPKIGDPDPRFSDQANDRSMFEQALCDHKPYVVEKRLVRPDGSQVWVRDNVAGVTNLEGNLEYLLTVSVDVTERKTIEEQLQQNQALLKAELADTKLLQEMDLAGIDLAVLLVIDFGIVYKNLPLTIEELHLEHKKVIDRSDRFIAFSSVDPRRGKEGVELFEKAVSEWGFRGLKVYSPCGFSPSDKRMFPYYEICSQRRLPVLTHVGPSSASLSFKRSNPLGVDDAALNFPKVNFILGHAGVTLYRQAALMAQYRPNIYLDLSGFQGELQQGQFKKILKHHLSRKVVSRLLFGTDWPIHRFWGGQAKWVNELKAYESEGLITQDDLQNIMSNNAKRILFAGEV